ncbi:hypothetical protein Tco_1054325 [Tanacetum coccineum]|uniref:Reverse transcriptase domain-containing protein n=1 Tax=Tanacetum coccineum TaxID=301880 RepID=A0ABQ5GWJ9_9ASTR
MGVYAPYPRKDTFTPLIKTPKKILAMESVSFSKPPPLIGTPKKQNLNKFCDYHEDRGHNTNNCYQLKKQIEEAVASGKLAHLVKDIRQTNQRNESQGRNNVKVINMIREGGNRKRSFEEERPGLMSEGSLLTVEVHQKLCMSIASETSMSASGQDSEDAGFRCREALWECRKLERVQGSWKEVQWRQCEEQMSRIKEQVILRTKNSSRR